MDFGSRILEISKLMKPVDQNISKDITSEDLVILVVERDTHFNPTSVVDANRDPMSEMITDASFSFPTLSLYLCVCHCACSNNADRYLESAVHSSATSLL